MKANCIVVEIVYSNTEAIVVYALLKRVTQHYTQAMTFTKYPAIVDKRLQIMLVTTGY